MTLKFDEYGHNNEHYQPTGVFVGRDNGNPRAVKIVRPDGSTTKRTFEDSRLADPLVSRALEIQRTNAPLSEF